VDNGIVLGYRNIFHPADRGDIQRKILLPLRQNASRKPKLFVNHDSRISYNLFQFIASPPMSSPCTLYFVPRPLLQHLIILKPQNTSHYSHRQSQPARRILSRPDSLRAKRRAISINRHGRSRRAGTARRGRNHHHGRNGRSLRSRRRQGAGGLRLSRRLRG